MKKSQSKLVNEASKAIGQKTKITYYKEVVDGEFMYLSGCMGIDPKKNYFLDIPVITHHSRKKELKRAIKKEGLKGVAKIVREEYERLER